MRELFFDLLRALPVNFQQHVGAGLHLLGDQEARSAIVIAVHFGRFEEFAAIAALQEVVGGGEIVFAAMLLGRARRAGRE